LPVFQPSGQSRQEAYATIYDDLAQTPPYKVRRFIGRKLIIQGVDPAIS
jgi:hypothetical protein